MKKILLLALPLVVMCAVSCEKEKEEEVWTDDSPIIQFKDPRLLEAILEPINAVDKNSDGQISEKEASVVESLYLSDKSIRNMDEIKYFTALTTLRCDNNQLTSLDVSKNTALTSLNCGNNQLTSLDVSKNTALTYLDCWNNQLTSLDLSKNTALTTLSCYDNQLTSLDVSKNTALTYLSCGNNQLTSLDVSKNTALIYLDCWNNQLTSLDVSKNTALTDLFCADNFITSLDVSMCHDLTFFKCVDFDSYSDYYEIHYESACPLESLRIYKYHVIDEDYINVLEEAYGDIIEYVE